MDNDRVALFVNRLSEKTRAGEIDWKSKASNSFVAKLGGYKVSISEHFGEDEDPEYADADYVIGISKGEAPDWIDSVNDQEMSDVLPGAFKIMQQIYRTARRNARGFGAAVEEIIRVMDDKL